MGSPIWVPKPKKTRFENRCIL